VKDDFNLETQSPIGKLYIDEEEWTNKQIVIQCDRKANELKYIYNATGP
jgi:hypothetical protein